VVDIQETLRCIAEMPVLKLQPFIHMAINIVTNFPPIVGLIMLASARPEAGFSRRASSEVAFLALAAFWIQQFNFALSEFVIAYATELWYRGRAPCCSIAAGYAAAVRYHLGTISFGGFIIGLMRPLRLIGGPAASWARGSSRDLGKLFSGLVMGYVEYLEPLSKSAFMDTALTSRPFWPAAQEAAVLVRAEPARGATWLFTVAGLSVVGGLGATCCLADMNAVGPIHRGAGLLEERVDLRGALLVAGAGALVAVSACQPFMTVLATVDDTIAYCAVERSPRNPHDVEWELRDYLGCVRQGAAAVPDASFVFQPRLWPEVEGEYD